MIRQATALAAGLSLSAMALAGPPAKYYQDDTTAMVRLDLASITVDNVKDAVNALVTQADLDAAGIDMNLEADVMSGVNQIGMVQMMTMALTSNGANYINIAVGSPPEGSMDGQPSMSFLLPANSEQGAQQILGFIQNFAGQIPGGVDTAAEMSAGQHWVAITPPGSVAPEGNGSASVRGALDGALESVGNHTLSVGMVPNEEMVSGMLENIPDEQGKAMVSTMMKADWMGMWLSVDGTPEFGVRMKYADAELAGQVEQMYEGAMGFMMAQAREADAEAGGNPEITLAGVTEQLNGWLTMEREGGVCTIKLDPAEMRELALLAMKAGPMLQQHPMFSEAMRQFQQNMPMN